MIGNSIIFFSVESQSKSLSKSINHLLISFGFEVDHTFIVRIGRFTLLPGTATRVLKSGSGSFNFGSKNSFGTASCNQIIN
jgi:hypothetical protein